MQCKKCQTNNRIEAKYCKKCGTALEFDNNLEYSDFFAKEDAIKQIERFKKHVFAAKSNKNINLNCIIIGDAGTGKNFIVQKLQEIARQNNLVSSKPVLVDASDYAEWQDKIDDNLSSIGKNGLLLIDDAQKLLPEDVAQDVNELDKLFSRMKKNKSSEMPIVFLSGSRIGLQPFLEKNPGIAALFGFTIETSPLGSKDLVNICVEQIRLYGCSVSDSAKKKLEQRFDFLKRQKDSSRGGHIAESVAQECYTNAIDRGSKTIDDCDIQGELFAPQTEEQIWKELDSFVGLGSVKEEIHKIIDGLKDAKRTGSKMKLEDHYVFSGNPGTGKTTIARVFAKILSNLAVLPQGHLVEVAGKDLIDQYIGGSEKKVQDAVDKSMGGILFIDEAYGLNDGQFGQAAIDKLLPMVENNRGKFICILAGYSKEMRDFMTANSGLKSRFNKEIEFPDYTPKELEEIFRRLAKKEGYNLSPDADEKLHFEMERMFNKKGESFGNGREVRNKFKEAEERRRTRLRNMTDDEILKEGKLLTYHDIAGESIDEYVPLEQIEAELNALVGLKSVKENISKLAAAVKRQKRLEEKGEKPDLVISHYQFLGNPGTGKTTVARLMGKMLYSLGFIQRKDVIEVKREHLVAKFQGETAIKTRKAVMDAMGGILFIDEAYNLINGQNDSFGVECINTLVPLLEDYRGKFVCICAGYTYEMKTFMETNSGLSSRLPEKIIFEDYSVDELFEIFISMCRKENLSLAEGTEPIVKEELERVRHQKDFGNARDVRNYLDKVKGRLALRTSDIDNPTKEQLLTIEKEDLL